MPRKIRTKKTPAKLKIKEPIKDTSNHVEIKPKYQDNLKIMKTLEKSKKLDEKDIFQFKNKKSK
jgi:hypothetical protein